jgi:dTDP-4-amino-4,6-dideoxygalactose transaminase
LIEELLEVNKTQIGENVGISNLLDNQEIKNYFYYSYARIALLEGLKTLGCDQGSNILLPAYICNSGAWAFHELGIEPRFYEVSVYLQPDINEIKTLVNKKTRGIMVVNYFGFPSRNFIEIKNICEEFNLLLIEDNSHGFISRNGSRLLGTLGDIGISSIWKCLPIPNGAVLFFNKRSLIENQEIIADLTARQNQYPRTSIKREYQSILSYLLSSLETRYKFPANFFRNRYRQLSLKGGSDNISEVNHKVRISNVSMRIIKGTDLEKVRQVRRQNFDFWLHKISKRQGADIVFNDLPDGICPLYFPLILENAESFSREMFDKGISVSLWPNLPKEILGNPNYPSANFLAQHMVVLPVHQSLNRSHLEKVFK